MIDYEKVVTVTLANIGAANTKNNTRFRVSASSLARLARVPYLTDEFFKNFDLYMGREGYSIFRVDNHVAIIRSDTTNGWTRVKLNFLENYEDEGDDHE